MPSPGCPARPSRWRRRRRRCRRRGCSRRPTPLEHHAGAARCPRRCSPRSPSPPTRLPEAPRAGRCRPRRCPGRAGRWPRCRRGSTARGCPTPPRPTATTPTPPLAEAMLLTIDVARGPGDPDAVAAVSHVERAVGPRPMKLPAMTRSPAPAIADAVAAVAGDDVAGRRSVLLGAPGSISTPTALPSPAVPATSVPIRLPTTTLTEAPAPRSAPRPRRCRRRRSGPPRRARRRCSTPRAARRRRPRCRRRRAGRIEADEIADHQVRRAGDRQAVAAVARDHVADADGVGRAVGDQDTRPRVADGRRADHVGADEVALHEVRRRAGPRDPHADPIIAGDEVAAVRRPAEALVPPMVLPWRPSMRTPSTPLPIASVPAASVPMKLPSTRLSEAPGAEHADARAAVARDEVAGSTAPRPSRYCRRWCWRWRQRRAGRPRPRCPRASVPAASVPMGCRRRGCPTR